MTDKQSVDRQASVPIVIPQLDLLAGAERSLLALASWLHRHGRAAHLVTYSDTCNFSQYANFPLLIVDLKVSNSLLPRIKALRRYFREQPASASVPIVSGYQPALHATLAGVKRFHCLMHDTPILFSSAGAGNWKQKLRTSLSNKVIGFGMKRGHGKMIVTSEFLQRDCLKQFGVQAEIARMGGMAHPQGFRARPVDSDLRMLSVCRIEANKRIDWMLDVLAELEHTDVPLSRRVDWRFDLVGNGSLLGAMRARAMELGLEERVRFHGFVSDEELAALYDSAHLFLMPAVQGYGIPAVEALHRGIPVLLHRDSGVSDILLETSWASVVHGGREELKQRLETMVEFLTGNHHIHGLLPPELPTEDSWAERVATLCGYV